MSSIEECNASWLTKSLTALGYSNPSSLTGCLVPEQDADDASLQQLTIWLEDRILRQWAVNEREDLRTKFQDSVERYLADLDCPATYYLRLGDDSHESSAIVERTEEPQQPQQPLWRSDVQSRRKVIFWLISCAMSEMYQECKGSIDEMLQKEAAAEKAREEDIRSYLHEESFPLGVVANDEPKVNDIVKALRIKYLMDLRVLQNKINEKSAEMQQLAAADRIREKEQQELDDVK